MTKVLLVGSNGKMGQEVGQVLKQKKAIEVIRFDKKKPADIFDFESLSGKQVDVCIDFSSPTSLRSLLRWAIKNKKPVVSGTTGLTPADLNELKNAGKKIPLLYSANMSLGICIMNRMITALAANKQGFDFQVEEFHHRHKKDSPSGTGLWIQKVLSEATGKSLPPILSARGGGVFGVHKVWAFADEEVLQVEHTALNRSVFAKGACSAADWLQNQKPGLYSIDDVLFGKKSRARKK